MTTTTLKSRFEEEFPYDNFHWKELPLPDELLGFIESELTDIIGVVEGMKFKDTYGDENRHTHNIVLNSVIIELRKRLE